MEKITVKIRIDGEYQIFEYEGDLNIPVTTLLERLDKPIAHSSSCLQGLCGACAMLINSQAKLACTCFINEEPITKRYKTITIEPLSKFPIIKDLKVDRSSIHKAMAESSQWLESDANINEKDIPFEHEMGLCLMCGCCLEECPNYEGGEFPGTPIAVSSAKLIKQEQDDEHLNKIKRNYEKDFYPRCTKSLICEDICPMKIPTQRAISIMNKSVWKIWAKGNGRSENNEK